MGFPYFISYIHLQVNPQMYIFIELSEILT